MATSINVSMARTHTQEEYAGRAVVMVVKHDHSTAIRVETLFGDVELRSVQ